MTSASTERTPLMIDPAGLRARQKAGDPPRILDVRTPGEYETAHIPGSHLVPLDTLQEHRDELTRHLDEDVVLVCRSGGRATHAALQHGHRHRRRADLLLSKLPYNRAAEPSLDDIVSQLADDVAKAPA